MSKEERMFCIQHYNYDNECRIIEQDGINCFIEYLHWEGGHSKFKAWVTLDTIRTKINDNPSINETLYQNKDDE
tara:strand:+ start:618 stop:839 length:222 start_codon:yes stop_codon:yes gene_type:complete